MERKMDWGGVGRRETPVITALCVHSVLRLTTLPAAFHNQLSSKTIPKPAELDVLTRHFPMITGKNREAWLHKTELFLFETKRTIIKQQIYSGSWFITFLFTSCLSWTYHLTSDADTIRVIGSNVKKGNKSFLIFLSLYLHLFASFYSFVCIIWPLQQNHYYIRPYVFTNVLVWSTLIKMT